MSHRSPRIDASRDRPTRRPQTGVLAAALVGGALAGCFTACGLDDPAPPQVPLDRLEDALGDVFCARLEECDCGEAARFATPEDCREWASGLQEAVETLVDDPGLVYDATCVGTVLGQYLDLACTPGADPYAELDPEAIASAQECVAPCAPISGGLRVGRPCMRFDALSSNCEPGLHCDGGQCRSWCPPVRDVGDACQAHADCGYVLYCDFGDNRCQAYAQLDERCEERACAAGLQCVADDPTDPASALRCQPMPEAGEPCMGHAECTTGYCPAGSCAPLPAPGESCSGTGICDEDSECIGEVCVGLPDLGEACDGECRADLRCEAGQCREAAATLCRADPPLLRND